MSLLLRRASGRLLLALCVLAGWLGAAEKAPASAAVDMNATLELLWEFVERAAESAGARLGVQLGDRLAGLTSEMADLKRTLGAQTAELSAAVDHALGTQTAEISAAVDHALGTQTGELNSRLDEIASAVKGPPPRDCSDLPQGTKSGEHQVLPGVGRLILAFCDQETDGGGWTVIQRRGDFQPRRDFYLDWAAYREGFGALAAEFWWGLKYIHALTYARDRQYELRIELGDWDGETRYAVYQTFSVSSEADGYRLSIGDYSGDAGDSMNYHNGQKFSTKDRNNDGADGSCAEKRQGGWWYKSCTNCNLNGPVLSGGDTSGKDGISWYEWRGRYYSLKTVQMKIRPTKKGI